MRLWMTATAAMLTAASAAAKTDTTHLTIYQGASALVMANTTVEVPADGGEVAIPDLPTGLQLATLTAQQANGDPISALRMPPKRSLLASWRGHEVTLLGADGERQTATLIDIDNGKPVVAVGDHLELLGPRSAWRLILPKMAAPDTARVFAQIDKGGRQTLGLSYLTRGLDWQADYTLSLNESGANLSGYATLHNTSGTDYDTAAVTLVAGTVQDPQDNGPGPRRLEMKAMASDSGAKAETLADWYRYRLTGEHALGDGETLRLALLAAAPVTVERSYHVTDYAANRGRSGERPVEVRLRVTAPEDDNRPLPAGNVRVIDRRGDTMLYQGGGHIDHTPAGKGFELSLGNAFDLQAKREQTGYQRLGENAFEVAWRIQLTNAGDAERRVTIREQLPGDWEIVQASAKTASRSAHNASWALKVPAGGTATLSYKARIRQ